MARWGNTLCVLSGVENEPVLAGFANKEPPVG